MHGTKENRWRIAPPIWFCNLFMLKVVDPCLTNPCQHGGTCSNNGLTFSCTYPIGFKPKACEGIF